MRTSILKFILIAAAALSACVPEASSAGAPQAWLDAPLDGMVLPLAAYELVGHGADPGGIASVEFSANGSVLGEAPASGALFTARQSWVPAAPGEYVIRARALSSSGSWSDYAEARVFVQGGEATATPVPTLTATPAASATPAATATPSEPTLVLVLNANCRTGPSQVYEALTSLLKDDVVRIVATNEDYSWWLVRIPSGALCWISAITGNAAGDLDALPIATAGPPPEEGCYVNDPNQNPVCTVPCPPNAVPGGACTP